VTQKSVKKNKKIVFSTFLVIRKPAVRSKFFDALYQSKRTKDAKEYHKELLHYLIFFTIFYNLL